MNWQPSAPSVQSPTPSYVSYFVASATNQAPQVTTSIGNQSLAARDLLELNVAGNFSDPDTDPLVYTASLTDGSPLPSWLWIGTAGLLTGSAPINAAGASLPIQITATDPNAHSVSQSFMLNVTPEAHGETGGQFSVNGAGNQAVVATNALGNEVVISTTSNNSLVGQLYNAQGQASGSQFVVATASGNDVPGLPAVAENAAGDFVVTRVESTNGSAPTALDIPLWSDPQNFYLQAFNATATPSGSAMQLAIPSGYADPNSEVPQGIPQVVADGTGEFDVAWLGASLPSNTTLWLQRFDAGGNALDSPVNALGGNFSTPFQQQAVLGIAADGEGNLTLMWGTDAATGTPNPVAGTINIQQFDVNDNPIGSARRR